MIGKLFIELPPEEIRELIINGNKIEDIDRVESPGTMHARMKSHITVLLQPNIDPFIFALATYAAYGWAKLTEEGME